jgi:hypothetical protein
MYPMPCPACGCVFTLTATRLQCLLTTPNLIFCCEDYCEPHQMACCIRLVQQNPKELN